jgi:uncharacterized protein with PIN domain
MNVVDSSAWIAYLTGSPNAAFLAKPIEATNKLLVPVLVLHEVFMRTFLAGWSAGTRAEHRGLALTGKPFSKQITKQFCRSV